MGTTRLTIDQTGNIKVEATGFVGTACADTTKKILAGMHGEQVKEEKKAEYHMADTRQSARRRPAVVVTFYTDGAYSRKHDVGVGRSTPRPGRLPRTWRGFKHGTTNNQMELAAIRQALVVCIMDCECGDNVIIRSDSKYALGVIQSTRDYAVNMATIDLCRSRLAKLRANGVTVSLEWCKGHANEYGNVLADVVSKRVRDDEIKRLAAEKTTA